MIKIGDRFLSDLKDLFRLLIITCFDHQAGFNRHQSGEGKIGWIELYLLEIWSNLFSSFQGQLGVQKDEIEIGLLIVEIRNSGCCFGMDDIVGLVWLDKRPVDFSDVSPILDGYKRQ